MKKNFDLKDLGAALSLANVWFVTVLTRLLYINDDNGYFKEKVRFEHIAVFIDILLLAFVFLILIKLPDLVSNIWLRRIFQAAFLILALCAFGGLSSEIIKWLYPGTINFVNIALPFFILFFCAAFAVKQKFALTAIVSNLKLLSLALLPFFFLICFQLFWASYNPKVNAELPSFVEKDVSTSRNASFPKVVWIIFDEFDYSILTTVKERNIDLSDIERLMGESFVAKNAFSPNLETTKSIPALLTGKLVKRTEPITPEDLTIYPTDESAPVSLRQSSNLISELDSLGAKIGIAGWAFPYPRIFKEKILYGYWRPMTYSRCADLIPCAVDIYRDSLLNVPFMTRIYPILYNNIDEQIERNNFLTNRADELVSNSKLDFLFFHFSIPHSPFITRQNLKGKKHSPESIAELHKTYFESLEMVNDTIKQLRETLEKSGQWDDTVFIISSDHWARFKTLELLDYLPEKQRQEAVNDARIPFIVKFAGQKTRVDYEPTFNTVITKELILAIVKEKIKNPEEFVLWLENLRANEPDSVNFRPDK